MTQEVQFLDSHYLALTAVSTVAMQVSFFIVAAGFKFDKVTDFAGGTNFVLNALLTFFFSGARSPRHWLTTFFIVGWGLRLSGFLLFRILKTGTDNRFDGIRENVCKFAVFWLFQAIWVWVVGFPVNLANSVTTEVALAGVDFAAIAVFGVGLLLEAVADNQKYVFKANPDNRGKWCDVGVWHYSRHPNYWGTCICEHDSLLPDLYGFVALASLAGEIMVWWGIWMLTLRVWEGPGPSWGYATIASPIFITLLLLFASGVPGLERSYDERFHDKAGYEEYIKTTSIMVPLPRFVYGSLPPVVKMLFLCEFPFYRARPPASVPV